MVRSWSFSAMIVCAAVHGASAIEVKRRMADPLPRLGQHVAASAGARSGEVKLGKVLNRMIFEPRRPVMRSSSSIMLC